MTMLKIICTCLALLMILAIFCPNTIESRVVQGNFGHIPLSRLQYLGIGDDQINGDSGNDDDREARVHSKRKSELLSSLYGLPYLLADGKRNGN